MSPFAATKAWLREVTYLPNDALHIHIGLILFLGAAALFRWPLKSWKPWAVVLCATLAGEAWDIIDRMRLRDAQTHWDNLKDILNTMFWPTALMLIARWTGWLRR